MTKGLALGAALAGVVFTGTAAADAATIGQDTKGTKYEVATNKLAALDITKGYPDGTVRPDENVTRAQTAAFMIRALNYQLAMDQSTTIFNDVAYEHPLSGAIQLASGQGIIKGYLDGTFRSEESVTIAQASAILVRMLGYSPAINEDDFPNSHLSKAAELGILKNVQTSDMVNAPAKRGDIMLMVANALTIDLMKQTEWGSDHKWEERKDENLLTEFFDLTVIETRNDFKDMKSDSYDGDLPQVRDTARTKIGSLKANELEFAGGLGGVHTLNEMFNATDFLAQEVQVWVDEDEDYVAYIADSKDQKVVVDKFDKWDYKDRGADNIKLDNGDDYDILDDASIYYNLEKPVKWDNFTKKDRMAETGVTSLVKVILDSNEDVVAMIVTDINESKFALVEDVDTSKRTINFMDGSAPNSQLKLDGKDFFIVRDGNIANLGDLQAEDVINYYQDSDDYYILATSDKVPGTIDDVSFTRSDDESSYKLSIDGKKYSVVKDATYSDNENEDIDEVDTDDLDEMDGEEATLYLNAAGEIQHILTGELSSSVGNVAVVTKNVKWLLQDEEWELTLVNEFGKEVKYRFESDDIDIDGEERNDDYIEDNLTIWDPKAGTDGEFVNEYIFIEYSVNKDGDLKSIDILSEGADKKYQTKYSASGLNLDKYDDNIKLKSTGSTYKVTRNTVFFDVTKNWNDSEYKDVDVISWDNIKDKEDNITEAYVKVKTNDRDVEYVFAVDADKNLKSKGEYGFITGFKNVGRDDAITITRIDGESLTLILDKKNPDVFDDGDFLKGERTDSQLRTKGAFIRYELDSDGEIDEWQVIASAGTKGGFYMAPGTDKDSAYNNLSIEYATAGVVQKSSNTSITLNKLDGKESESGNVVVNNNTVYIDLVDDGEMSFASGVNSGDFVLAIDTDDDGNAADFVLILDEDYKTDGSGGKGDGETGSDTEGGIVSLVGEKSIVVDDEVYFLDDKTILRDKDNSIIALGAEAVAEELEKDTQVKITTKDGITTIKILKTPEDIDLEKAQEAAEKASVGVVEGDTQNTNIDVAIEGSNVVLTNNITKQADYTTQTPGAGGDSNKYYVGINIEAPVNGELEKILYNDGEDDVADGFGNANSKGFVKLYVPVAERPDNNSDWVKAPKTKTVTFTFVYKNGVEVTKTVTYEVK